MTDVLGGPPASSPSAPPPATGRLVLDLHRPPGPAGAGLTPVLTLDGLDAPARWGRNTFAAPPGPHHVSVATAGLLWRFGAAQQVVDVASGRVVELGYRSPLVTAGRGRLGSGEQPGPVAAAVAGLLTLLVPALLVALLVLVLPLR